ncbi:hypothetical protein [Hyalangium gracile]|uniref:hypothetical protein n=1 Tax=Hyalangium gracile TaxID=394092 RepID=UPI001CCE4187|nr:hypothetical protein [Hyalangium gracile]
MAPCSRCGTFLCGDCTEVLGEEAFCADCMDWLRRNGPPSRAVKWLIGGCIAGIFVFPLVLFLAAVPHLVLGVAAMRVATRELRRIERGEGPLRGIPQAKVARALGVAHLVLSALWALPGLFIYFTWGPGSRGPLG